MSTRSAPRARAAVARAAGSGAAWGIGAGAAGGSASHSSVLYSLSRPLLGAACDGSDGIAGTSSIGRGFACLGVGSGNGGGDGGGGGGGWGRAPAATRALSSSNGDGGGGVSSSLADKLAAKRLAREKMEPGRRQGVGERAAGGAARGGSGGSGASARVGGGGGGRGGGGRGGAGGRGNPSPAALLNGRISHEATPEGLLRLVADEHPNFNDVNVATAFSKFGKLCDHRSFPRNIAADDGFRGLLVRAGDMCAEGRL